MEFIDLAAQQATLRDKIDARIATVLDHGGYIMGPEVTELESALSAFCGAKHALTCANGTDALQLALMALGIGANDVVFCPAFTFAATAEVIPAVFNICPASLQRAIAHAQNLGLTPAAVIAVDIFGLPADYDSIEEICARHGMRLIADSAQGFGGSYKSRRTGTIGDITTTSFFPAKPLGCYGDGGALFTQDEKLAELIRSLRVHGKGSHKYDNHRIGMNSRHRAETTPRAQFHMGAIYCFNAKRRASRRHPQSVEKSRYPGRHLLPNAFASANGLCGLFK